jgi:hypothetical protein
MFADDPSILCTAKVFKNLKMKLDIVLMHMSMWFQSNQFALNLDKTHVITSVPISATSYPLHTLYFNKILIVVYMIKSLGVQLDPDLQGPHKFTSKAQHCRFSNVKTYIVH